MTTNTAPDNNTIDGQITEVANVTALATFNPTEYAAAAMEPFKVKLTAAKRAAKRAEFDITTTAGMKEAKVLRASFRDIRTGIENARKEAKGPILEAGKKVDAVAKELTDEVVPHEQKYDAAIKAEEDRIEAEKQAKIAAERARIEAIEGRISHIRNLSKQLAQADSATLSAKVEELATKRLDPAMYDEHLEDAVNALNAAVDELRVLHQQALAREAEERRVAEERAELARLKAEQAERERAEREAEAERQRLARAEADRIEAERRAAAEREADLMRQLEAMKAQIAASQPQPAAAPAVDLAAPGADATVTAEIEQDHTGIIVGHVQVSSTAPADAPLDIVDEPVPYVAPTVLREPMRVEPAPRPRPADMEIIELVANKYGESLKTALDWLANINFARAYDQLTEKA